MKSGQLFWGFLFVTIGALILLAKFDVIYFEWDFVWNLWPILLILWGLLIISKKSNFKPVLAVLFGITTGIAVYGVFASTINGFDCSYNYDMDLSNSRFEDFDNSKDTYNVAYDSDIKKAVLNMEVGAGTFSIRRTSHDLLNGFARGDETNYKFSSVTKNNVAYVGFSQEDRSYNILDHKNDNRLDIRLNDNPVWDMDIRIGAAKALFELDDFAVESLNLKTGATDIDLKLGAKAESSRVEIEMGAANLDIQIPDSVGCKISGKMALMSRKFSGFEKSEDGDYLSDNFDKADKKIYIHIKGAVASVKVDRY